MSPSPSRLSLLWVAAAAPLVSHFLAFSWSVVNEDSLVFGKLDLLVLIAALILLALVALFWSAPAPLSRLTTMIWAMALPLLAFEFGLRWLHRPIATPWPPRTVKHHTLSPRPCRACPPREHSPPTHSA